MAKFATVDDINRGRPPFSDDDKADADALIAAAGEWIRERKPGIADDDPAAHIVVIQVVRTAMDTRRYSGHTSYSKTVGGVTRSGTLANPGALLAFDDSHYQLLRISRSCGASYYFGDGCE